MAAKQRAAFASEIKKALSDVGPIGRAKSARNREAIVKKLRLIFSRPIDLAWKMTFHASEDGALDESACLIRREQRL